MGAIQRLRRPQTNIAGGPSTLPENRSQAARQASTSLANFLRANGQPAANMNDLMKIARNQGGSVPAHVSDAASFMLSHPQLFSKLESRDEAAGTQDGIASVESLDHAATGAFDATLDEGLRRGPAAMPGHEALDLLNTFRAGSPGKQLDAQTLYQLAQHPEPDAPPALAQAARRALGNTDLLRELRLDDGPGVPRKPPEPLKPQEPPTAEHAYLGRFLQSTALAASPLAQGSLAPGFDLRMSLH
ncbi:hypothetical protein [Paracidovorax anthurii]|uniref:Uncharacterized protein n=1 Tax=Paracidovorax anthurii TaxID=78229 RepID=A0A328ZCZ0_9BURK|nr:hypothetical protein [Paracidovorax anthurii]RAR83243.1 hypothetical protein AX018_101589 [Paracidovorax anthurii]